MVHKMNKSGYNNLLQINDTWLNRDCTRISKCNDNGTITVVAGDAQERFCDTNAACSLLLNGTVQCNCLSGYLPYESMALQN